MAFDPAKFIKARIEVEESWKQKFRNREVKIDLKDLGASDKNPFLEITPEHESVLIKPHTGQQHRMQDLRVTKQWGNRGLSTFIALRTDFSKPEEVTNYFGDPIEVVANYCVETASPEGAPPLLPMILAPQEYLKKPELLDLYAPLFKRLHDAGKDQLLVFANRMEDCLAYQKYDKDWLTLKGEEIDYWDEEKKEKKFWDDEKINKQPSFEKGHLPVRWPADYLRERIAWLRILELEDFAKDIIRIVLVEEDVPFACDVAFILHTLLIGPIFYSHKTTTALHGPFDTEQLLTIGKSYAERVLEWRMDRALRHISILQLLAMILGYGAFSYLVPTPPEFPYIIPQTAEATNKVLRILSNDPDGLLNYDNVNLTVHKHLETVGQRNEEGATATSKEFLLFRERLVSFHAEKFADVKQAIRASVRVLPVVGSVWTPEDPRLKWFFRILEKEAEGKGLVGKADEFLEKVWQRIFPITHPILKYQPDFRIYDLSDLIGRGE